MIPAQYDFRLLKRQVPIAAVLGDQGLLHRFRVRGDRLTGPCPLHQGDNERAFVVSRSKNCWYCFSDCSSGGDVVDLVHSLLGMSYREVARYLASLTSVPPQPLPPAQPALQRTFRPFRKALPLEHDVTLLRSKGIFPEVARRYEVGGYGGLGMLSGCVACRLHDPDGKPLGYAGRRVEPDDEAKWVFPPGFPKRQVLYGYHQVVARFHLGVVLTECPWGVLRLAQLGIPAVALLGVHLSPRQEALLAEVPRVTLLLDGDRAGRMATKRISQQLGSRATAASLGEGLDPDDLDDGDLLGLLLPFLARPFFVAR